MADRRIIILEKDPDANRYRTVLWAVVPVERRVHYAQPGFVSAYKDILPEEKAKFETGEMVEEVYEYSRSQGGGIAAAQADLEARWTDFQNSVNLKNPWVRYGTSWDGTTWTNDGASTLEQRAELTAKEEAEEQQRAAAAPNIAAAAGSAAGKSHA